MILPLYLNNKNGCLLTADFVVDFGNARYVTLNQFDQVLGAAVVPAAPVSGVAVVVPFAPVSGVVVVLPPAVVTGVVVSAVVVISSEL